MGYKYWVGGRGQRGKEGRWVIEQKGQGAEG